MEWIQGSHVARGATAVVTRSLPGIVVKTLDAGVPVIAAKLEAAGTRAANNAGLPSPTLHEFDEGPPARLVMDFVDGQPLGELVALLGPTFVGEELARCQDLVRRAALSEDAEVMDVIAFLTYQIDAGPLPSAVKSTLLAELNDQPTGAILCHMDLHPLNILWDGERSTMIDWMTAARGPAAVDVARTRVILEALPHLVGNAPEQLAAFELITQAFLATTSSLAPDALRGSDQWLRILRGARLAENPPVAERAALLQGLGLELD